MQRATPRWWCTQMTSSLVEDLNKSMRSSHSNSQTIIRKPHYGPQPPGERPSVTSVTKHTLASLFVSTKGIPEALVLELMATFAFTKLDIMASWRSCMQHWCQSGRTEQSPSPAVLPLIRNEPQSWKLWVQQTFHSEWEPCLYCGDCTCHMLVCCHHYCICCEYIEYDQTAPNQLHCSNEVKAHEDGS